MTIIKLLICVLAAWKLLDLINLTFEWWMNRNN